MWADQKDPYNKKKYPAGVHGDKGYKRITEFGTQLLSKQKLRFYYGDIRESQFKIIFKKAKKKKGDTGENIIGLLESRLDSFVYRTRFVSTMFAARQFVSHRHVLVNDKIVNIPSYILKPGDAIKIKKKSLHFATILEAKNKIRDIPEYIKVNDQGISTYLEVPKLLNVPYNMELETNDIVEFYSR